MPSCPFGPLPHCRAHCTRFAQREESHAQGLHPDEDQHEATRTLRADTAHCASNVIPATTRANTRLTRYHTDLHSLDTRTPHTAPSATVQPTRASQIEQTPQGDHTDCSFEQAPQRATHATPMHQMHCSHECLTPQRHSDKRSAKTPIQAPLLLPTLMVQPRRKGVRQHRRRAGLSSP